MDWKEFTGKTVNEALQNACIELEVTTDNIEYEVVEKESKGFLGIMSKPAIIKAKKKETKVSLAKNFLKSLFEKMNMEADVDISINEEEKTMDVNLTGNDMGSLIGKRGQTLDSIQYLLSLVVNNDIEDYYKITLDTENYRQRRKDTLENLAKNIASKVKKTHRSVTLEPMNPYERRIIHSALQNDDMVETHSEGENPYRMVVVTLKKEYRDFNGGRSYSKPGYKKYGKNGYNRNYKGGGYNKYNSYGRSRYHSNESRDDYKEKSYESEENINESAD